MSEYKALIRLGIPVLITQLGIIILSFADTMMVGTYGVDQLAAAAFVNSLFFIPIVMQLGFAGGLTPLIGALFTQGDNLQTGRMLRAGVQGNAFLAVGLTVVMGIIYFFLDRFGQPSELLPLIRSYYLIILASLLPMAVFNAFQQTCNGINDTSLPMWMILASNVLNILGNYLFIFGHLGCPELGLDGAGYSTLFARYFGCIVLFIIFTHKKRYRRYMHGFHDGNALGELRRRVWTTSYPLMIQSGIECGLWSLGAVVSGWFGKVQLAAFQVVNTMSQLGFMTFISFGVAASIRVANYTGVNDFPGIRRATSAALRLNLGLATLASLIFWFGGAHLIHIFSRDSAVIASGLTLILPLVVYQYMDATQLTYINAIRGTSHVKPLLWISIAAYIIIGTPSMLLLAKGLDLGNVGVYWSFNIALLAAAMLAVIVYRRTLTDLDWS
ncbi:MAG: MATE family efflux transporter [Muribaculaceae bacterium]|nr:MATE family efflux transporter [Muribaculaceae bacterium]